MNDEVNQGRRADDKNGKSSDARVARVEARLDSVDHHLEMMSRSINELVKSRTTQWPAVFAGVSVLFVAVTTVGWLTITPINEQIAVNREDIASDGRRVDEHSQDGHPARIEDRVVRTEEDVATLQAWRVDANAVIKKVEGAAKEGRRWTREDDEAAMDKFWKRMMDLIEARFGRKTWIAPVQPVAK